MRRLARKAMLVVGLALMGLPAHAWLGLTPVLSATTARAERAIPPLTGPVIDETGTLNADEAQTLSQELRSYPPHIQLEIWIVPSLEGEPIESLSIRAADKWKLGTAKQDRGAILLVAQKEHRARIEVGQGLEGDIPDALAGRIIDRVLAPAFRQGDYFGGLQQASRVLYQRAGGDVTTLAREATPQSTNGGHGLSWLEILILLVFLGVWALPLIFGSRRSRFGGGGGWWRGGGGGFGGGGLGGGGGGWSGGGGGFSGGGASGDW